MNLKQIRNKLNLTQIEAAKKIGVTLTTWRMWEYGANKPNEENQKKLNKIIKMVNVEE